LTHAIVGNDVIIHAGVRIGQDGFGFAMSPSDLESGRRNEMHNSARLDTEDYGRHVAPCSRSSHDVLEAPMASQIGFSQRYERCYHCHTGWRWTLTVK
jgi:hypothetical protein